MRVAGWGLFLAFLSASASATTFYGGISAFSPSIKGVSKSDSGAIGLFAPWSFPAGLKAELDMGAMSLWASVDYTLLGRVGPEKKTSSRVLLIRTPLSLAFGDLLDLLVGPAVKMSSHSGAGGAVVLSDGNSSSPFGVPSTSQKSWLVAVDVGLHWHFGRWLVSQEALVEGFANSSKRNFAALVGLSYRFGGGGK